MNDLPLFPIARALLTVAGLKPFADDTRGCRFRMTQETADANTVGDPTDLPLTLYGYPVEIAERLPFFVELVNDGNVWAYNTQPIGGTTAGQRTGTDDR